MYEKPQYLTPNGLQRHAKNPFKGSTNQILQQKSAAACNGALKPCSIVPLPAGQVREGTDNRLLSARLLKPRPKKQPLSEESARLIAQALKGLLKG